METHQLGYFGNIWVRQNILTKMGDYHPGHKHYFDHVSLLASGKVRVTVEGYPSKDFTAPTFIIIKKDHNHKFEALTDGVLWYCVFALRDENGELTDFYSGDNSPYGPADSENFNSNKQNIEKLTQEV